MPIPSMFGSGGGAAMGVRDFFFTVTIVCLLPFCFIYPWIGVLVWSWLSYMNPHRYTFGFVHYHLPSAQLVALATLGGFVLAKDRKPFPWTRETVLMFALWAWFTVTTFLSLYPEEAWNEWDRVSKILVVSLLTVPLFQDRKRLRYLLLVIAFSIGFYGVKGALFVIATGGRFMVEGVPGRSFISANNGLALALNMCLPIQLYLAREEPRRWLKLVLYGTFFGCMLAVPFTYSRGAVIGLGMVLGLLFLKSRAKFVVLPVALAAMFAFSVFVPDKWVARMQTVEHYEKDASANARLIAWRVALMISRDHPIFGLGFECFNPQTWARYMPGYRNYHDAHSIYFNLLGEHGYPGLILFLLLVGFTLLTLYRVRRLAARYAEMKWIENYSHMLQVSIVAYLVTGSFLSVAYFDLSYHLFLIVIVLKVLSAQELERLQAMAQSIAANAAHPLAAAAPSAVPEVCDRRALEVMRARQRAFQVARPADFKRDGLS